MTGNTKYDLIEEKRSEYIKKIVLDELEDEDKKKARIDKLKKIIKNVKKQMSRKIDNKIFIEECKNTHGDLYDYSLVEYKKSRKSVKIICKKHGTFDQIAFHHKNGKGCPKCFYEKNRDSNFIKNSIKIHGDNYDYSLVNYINNRTKVKIKCKEHGIFEQIPQSHLNGFGCKKCSIESGKYGGIWKKMHTKEKFIEKAIKVHGDKFDYSIIDYKGSNVKIDIICPSHGIFSQTPRHHLYDRGCPKCNSSKGEINIENFLNENNIYYETQYSFEGCCDVLPLYFDFYLPDHKMCIEFDGEQHFKPLRIFGGEKAFHNRKRKDNIKNIYCKENNIELMRIKYNENISKKLKIEFYGKKQIKIRKQKIQSG